MGLLLLFLGLLKAADLQMYGLDEGSGTNLGQRYFLAEILKKSSIAPYDLMNFILERRIEPVWYNIALPNGALGIAFEELATAEKYTYRSFRLLMHGSLATTPCERPGSVPGPYPTYGHFRTAVSAKYFEAEEEASRLGRNCSLSSGPNDTATAATQLPFREFS